MLSTNTIAVASGLFIFLACNHVLLEFCLWRGFAKRRADPAWYGVGNALYGIGFLPLLYLLPGITWQERLLGVGVLGMLRQVDPHNFLYWWALHVDREPLLLLDGKQAFDALMAKPVGLLAGFMVRQVYRLTCLWVIVVLALT